jgi:BTB/POZ domain
MLFIKYQWYCSTLTSDPNSMLARLVTGALNTARDSQHRIFIDRDGSLFLIILQWLRDPIGASLPPSLHMLQALQRESDFYQLGGLTAALAIRLPGPQSPAEIAVQYMKSQLHDAFQMYLQSAHWTQLSLSDWQRYALGLRNAPSTRNGLDGLRVQLVGYLYELTKSKSFYTSLWKSFCSCYGAHEIPLLQIIGCEENIEEAVVTRYDAANNLLCDIQDGKATLSMAEASIRSLNEPLYADQQTITQLKVNGLLWDVKVPAAASSGYRWKRWKRNVTVPPTAVSSGYRYRIPICSRAEQLCWSVQEQDFIEPSRLLFDCETSPPSLRLPCLTTDGLVQQRRHNMRAEILGTERSLWVIPPNDHWSPVHDDLVLRLWDAYLAVSGQSLA